jgi:hypothetical protein
MTKQEKILNTKKGIKKEGIKVYIEYEEAIDAMNEFSQNLKEEIYALELMVEQYESRNTGAIISKLKEINNRHESVLNWILRHTPEIKESLRYKNHIDEINDMKSELSALEQSPSPMERIREEDEPKLRGKNYDFVVNHKVLVYNTTHKYMNYTEGKNDPEVQKLISIARKEIGYSDKTWSGDIYNILVNLYIKICV